MEKIVGYIVMVRPKTRKRSDAPALYAPMAYSAKKKDYGHSLLLRDRGATMFKTGPEAGQALEDTLRRATAAGHEWPKTSEFLVVQVKAPPLDAEPGV